MFRVQIFNPHVVKIIYTNFKNKRHKNVLIFMNFKSLKDESSVFLHEEYEFKGPILIGQLVPMILPIDCQIFKIFQNFKISK